MNTDVAALSAVLANADGQPLFHDGCTAGPLSQWLDGMIAACCNAHDSALDHSTDLATFAASNWDFAACVWAVQPWLAPIVFMAVAGPVGLALYLWGPKRPKGETP